MKSGLKIMRTVSVSSMILLAMFLVACGGGGGNGPKTYSISGQVTSDGTGLSGVTITLSEGSSGTTTTDSDGSYSFSALSNGSYAVTPSLTSYTFDPTSRNLTISGSNVSGVDFSAFITDADVSISENSVVLDDETTESLASVSSDNSTLTFDSSTSTLETLQQDDVVVIGVTDETPYGLLRKVTSITQEGDQVVVETTQARLTDLIEEGTISVSKTLTTNDINTSNATVKTLKGVSLAMQPTMRNARVAAAVGIDPETELFNWKLQDVVLYDRDGNENTLNDQVVANGEISFGLGFDLEIQIKWLKVQSLTFTTTPWQTAELSISSTISQSIEEKVWLAEFYAAPIEVIVPIPVPPFALPVVFVPVVTLYVGLDGEVSVDLDTWVAESASLTAGIEYKNSEWSPIRDLDIDFNYLLPDISASASIKGYVEPDLALMIYGVVGPYSTLQGYLKLDADIYADPWWSLYAGITVGAGVKIEVIGYEIVKKEFPDIINYEKELAHAEHSATWYKDADGDGYSDGTSQISVDRPATDYYQESELTATSGDCNDNDDSIYPGATEICDDGIDQDCDGSELAGSATWYRDQDEDGYGDPNDSTQADVQPEGYVSNNDDNCPNTYNPDQADSDGDGIGDVCEEPLGMTFQLIRAGTFTMGSPTDELFRGSDETQHEVTLSKDFYIQTTEVTQGQWKAVMGSNPSYFSDCGDDCPVEYVSWNDIQEFIEKLNEMEGTDKYRLPTEAEWEYACRAGSTTAFANGDITETGCGYDPNLDQMSWYCGNSDDKTHPVAQKEPNDWGLYDMHGNVREWCQDWYGDYPTDPVTDPSGPSSGTYRVIRGGGWFSYARHCRSADRLSFDPAVLNFGFRVARDL